MEAWRGEHEHRLIRGGQPARIVSGGVALYHILDMSGSARGQIFLAASQFRSFGECRIFHNLSASREYTSSRHHPRPYVVVLYTALVLDLRHPIMYGNILLPVRLLVVALGGLPSQDFFLMQCIERLVNVV